MEQDECNVLASRQQRKKRWTIVLLGTVGCFAVALVFLLSPGNKFDIYTFDDPCAINCGQHAGNALLCLEGNQGRGYCSRPCGEQYQDCPSNFECKPWSEDGTAAEGPGTQNHSLYCVKVAESAAPILPSLALGQPVIAPAQIAFEPETITLPQEYDIQMGPFEVSNQN